MENVLLQYGVAGVFILVLCIAVKELSAYVKQLVEENKTLSAQYRDLLVTSIKVIEQNTEAQSTQQDFNKLLKKLDEVGRSGGDNRA